MKDFNINTNIQEDLYVPIGANLQPVHKFGKVALVLFCSAAVTPSAVAEQKSFTIEACTPEPVIDNKQLLTWKQIYTLFNNEEKLMIKVRQLPASQDWEDYGMECPKEQAIDNTIQLIKKCPVDQLLASVSVLPRVNGTILLKWDDKDRLATVNIGTEQFAYAIISRRKTSVSNGDYWMNEPNMIEKFYSEL